MSEATPQELLAKLLTDPRALAELRQNPDACAARYGLPAQEVRRLSTAGMPGLRVAASVTRWKNLSAVMGSLPATLALCQAVVDDDTIVGEVLAHVRMTTPRGVVSAGERLGELASRHAGDARRSVIQDVVRYETLSYEIREHAAQGQPDPGRGPSLGACVRAVTFGCPVAEVQRRILAGRPFEDLRERTTHYLVSVRPGGRMRVHRIPEALRDLLGLCDGSRPVTVLSHRLGMPTDRVEQALAKVRALGVEIRTGPAA
ncbi:hypothetical protein GCM10010297_03540 [Streptomyces malachitofuscus]|nr:hypothetical protein GCM10010297_03540 [Streptomyces malachitofuscus]